jgi:cytochrome c-type biogenesis protein CcmH/NrfG
MVNAISAFENASAINPTNANYSMYLAQLYFSTGKKNEGYDALTKMIAADETNMNNLKMAGDICKQIGDESTANYYYNLYNDQLQIMQEQQENQENK